MITNLALIVLASTAPVPVPDVSPVSIALGLGALSLGIVARVIKNRKK